MLVDTHCHLDDPKFQGEVPEILARAREVGVAAMVTIGTSIESTQKALAIAREHDGVRAAAGIHPHHADSVHTPKAFEPLVSLAEDPAVVAIGETGLDFHRDYADPKHQQSLLSLHLDLARRTGKPLVIHCREAYAEFIERVRRELAPPAAGVMHCFSGSAEDARRLLDLGFHISVAGPVTFPNARRLREVVRRVPLDRLVLETDAPYLAPQEFRGRRNEPAYLRFTARRVAELLGVDYDRFCESTTRNAAALFGLRV